MSEEMVVGGPFVVDFSGVAAQMAALPPGNYPAIIENVEMKTSKAGKPMLLFTFRITSGPHMDRKVFQNYSFEPQARWKLYQTLRALGWSEADMGGQLELDPNELINLECTIVLKPSEYNGRATHKVASVLPAGAGGGVSPSEMPHAAEELPF